MLKNRLWVTGTWGLLTCKSVPLPSIFTLYLQWKSIYLRSFEQKWSKAWFKCVTSKSQDDWIHVPDRNGYLVCVTALWPNSAAILHLPSKAWIAVRWALRTRYMMLDYLNVKDSWETVVPTTRPGNPCTGAAYPKALCQWENYSLQLSGFCRRPGLPGPARRRLCPWYSARQRFPHWCRDTRSDLVSCHCVGSSGSHGVKSLVDIYSR